jgi:hypothetical protein
MYLIAALGFVLLHLLVAVAIWVPLMAIHIGTKWLGEMNADQIILRICSFSLVVNALCIWIWLVATQFEGKVPTLVLSPFIYWVVGCALVLRRLVQKSRLDRFDATKTGCMLMGALALVLVIWKIFFIWAKSGGFQSM